MDTQEGSQLLLEWQEQQLAVGVTTPEAVLGSQDLVHLQQRLPFVSREHLTLQQREQTFVLVDHSTNGTYVQTEDEQVTWVHHGELRLWGSGLISLGEAPRADNVIRFQLLRQGESTA